VWIYEDGVLRVREVEVLRADRLQSLVASGLEGGDLVVVSSLDAVTDGMKVRRAGDELAVPAGADANEPAGGSA